MPHFTLNYARPYIKAWNSLFRSVGWNPAEPKTIVEIGSAEGSSALWFANNLLRHPDSVLYCIDFWPNKERHALYNSNIAEYEGPAKIIPMKMRSVPALLHLIEKKVTADLVYVDGDHGAPGVLSDLVLSFNLIRVGGLVICDDYLWNDPKHGGSDVLGRPKIAIDAFTTIYGNKIRILKGMPLVQIAFQKASQ